MKILVLISVLLFSITSFAADKISRENPRKAFKKTSKGLKREKCIGKGAHIGGNNGKVFMGGYLKFWKENLIFN